MLVFVKGKCVFVHEPRELTSADGKKKRVLKSFEFLVEPPSGAKLPPEIIRVNSWNGFTATVGQSCEFLAKVGVRSYVDKGGKAHAELAAEVA